MKKRIAIIGAGASGLMAACCAAERHDVVLFEKEKKVGRKILASGNGKCNLSNRFMNADRFHTTYRTFINHVLGRAGLNEIENYFFQYGLPFGEENLGRLFPLSGQASSVVDFFLYQISRLNIRLKLGCGVSTVTHNGDIFTVTSDEGEDEDFDAVILASGSCAHAPLGGSSRGYALAASLGHRVLDPFPAIVPITVDCNYNGEMQGIRRVCSVRVTADTESAAATGEVQFTSYGLSGPAILDVSRCINGAVVRGEEVKIFIDFFPGWSHEQFLDMVEMLLNDKEKPLLLALNGVVQNKIAAYLIARMGKEAAVCGSLTAADRKRLRKYFRALELNPGKPRDFSEAVAAAGGVDVREVDPVTMESKIIPNLFLTGELLDVDGDSGGFNLQFAWSSGLIAGQSV